ncbi:MAG: arginine N-succinyltransferase [Caulobacteraceae bacterium]|nr:arginine N-succinyltransferase [Caulobacteraceae bacterium]
MLLSATTDNQFILDLMPQHAIYVDLLSQEARDVVGQVPQRWRGARVCWNGRALRSPTSSTFSMAAR